MENKELKPCPFCGSKAEYKLDYWDESICERYFVKCTNCITTLEDFSQEAVIAAWNKRFENEET